MILSVSKDIYQDLKLVIQRTQDCIKRKNENLCLIFSVLQESKHIKQGPCFLPIVLFVNTLPACTNFLCDKGRNHGLQT